MERCCIRSKISNSQRKSTAVNISVLFQCYLRKSSLKISHRVDRNDFHRINLLKMNDDVNN